MPRDAPPAGLEAPALGRLTFGLDPGEGMVASDAEAAGALQAEAACRLPAEAGRILVLSEGPPPKMPVRADRAGPIVTSRPGDELPAGPFQALWIHECAHRLGGTEALVRRARVVLEPGALLLLSGPVRYGEQRVPWLSAGDQAAALAEGGFCILERERLGARLRVGAGNADGPSAEALFPPLREGFAAGRLGYEILAARKEERFVRAYRPGDEEEILALFREQFHAERSADHFRWKYLDNPWGGPCMSLIFSEEGPLLAHYAGYPVPFRIGPGAQPADVPAMQVGDTMTRPEGRRVGLGPTSLLARVTRHFYARYLEERTAFAYGFNTGRIRKFGSRYMDYGYLEPVALWTRSRTGGPGTRPWRFPGRWRAERLAAFTGDFDRFFDRACRRYGILALRDSACLSWRYLRRPDHRYSIYAVRRWGRLRGWGVFLQEGDRLLWGDALFDTDAPGAAEALLGAALQDHPGAASVEAWFAPRPAWWTGVLQHCGFRRTGEPHDLAFCYKMFARPDLEDALKDGLYYTWGDSDLF